MVVGVGRGGEPAPTHSPPSSHLSPRTDSPSVPLGDSTELMTTKCAYTPHHRGPMPRRFKSVSLDLRAQGDRRRKESSLQRLLILPGPSGGLRSYKAHLDIS